MIVSSHNDMSTFIYGLRQQHNFKTLPGDISSYAEHGITYVVHIGENQQGADLSCIYQALRDGEQGTEAMLQSLGIETSLLLDDDAPMPWLN